MLLEPLRMGKGKFSNRKRDIGQVKNRYPQAHWLFLPNPEAGRIQVYVGQWNILRDHYLSFGGWLHLDFPFKHWWHLTDRKGANCSNLLLTSSPFPCTVDEVSGLQVGCTHFPNLCEVVVYFIGGSRSHMARSPQSKEQGEKYETESTIQCTWSCSARCPSQSPVIDWAHHGCNLMGTWVQFRGLSETNPMNKINATSTTGGLGLLIISWPS